MKAIETHYRGFRFRSRLEARWAVFFDRLGIRWEYEAQGYLVNGRPYLPDFKLLLPDDHVVFAEVKADPADLFEGEHVALCRALATGTGHPVVLLVGVPAYRMYNQLTPDLPPNAFTAAFFTDYGAKLTTADAYWFQQAIAHPETGALEFPHDDRAARKSFGQGLVDAVAAARSARFEHARSPDHPERPGDRIHVPGRVRRCVARRFRGITYRSGVTSSGLRPARHGGVATRCGPGQRPATLR